MKPLSLIAYEHTMEGLYEDEVVLKFAEGAQPHAAIPLERINPAVLASLRAHIKGFTAEPIHFVVTGFTADSGLWLTIEITMHRMAPGSADHLIGKNAAQNGWIQEIANLLEVQV